MSQLLQAINDHVYHGKVGQVRKLVKEALNQGVAPREILDSGLLAGMHRAGHDFLCGDCCESEVLEAARALRAGRSLLRPWLPEMEIAGTDKYLLWAIKCGLCSLAKKLRSLWRA